jgi:quinol monooxygenase YgiN
MGEHNMDKQLTIVAHLRARPDKIEEAKSFLLSLIDPTRAEPGCIDYDMHQDDEDPTKFVFYENWTSRDELEKHMQTPHLTEMGHRKGDFLAAEPEVHFLTMVSGRVR